MDRLHTGRFLLATVCIAVSTADMFLHNMRGSNNRLDETSRNVRNNKRLFNSQDNNRGGYNVAGLYYYSGSKLDIEWTNQHTCNSPNANCEIVLQYMCGDLVRNGGSTRTIPDNIKKCQGFECHKDMEYGMHEDFGNWITCKQRQRNDNLFTADQDLNRDTARHTRQNPGGTRYGYECSEERDYYPYWHQTPWKDIAVFTNDMSRCAMYEAESQNVKSRWACHIPLDKVYENRRLVIPNNQADCEAFTYRRDSSIKGEWREYPAHNIAAPECLQSPYSRDNHLGNGIGGQHNSYTWTVPDIEEDACVMRIRYNISTNDYDSWNTDASSNADDNEPTKIDLSGTYGFPSFDEAASRGYVFENNPAVVVFEDAAFELQLAINTAQFGRTFQDRSHVFAIKPKPSDIDATKPIYNLNARGKRGNIVEAYPSTEYDFVPNTLQAVVGDYIHVQWTGSNTNNRGNDGEGLAGTDRHNWVLLSDPRFAGSVTDSGPGSTYGHLRVNYPMHFDNVTLTGIPMEDVLKLAQLYPGGFTGEISQLDDASPYFDMGLQQLPGPGTYHYMCSRNNNFSNRDQKGRIEIHAAETKR